MNNRGYQQLGDETLDDPNSARRQPSLNRCRHVTACIFLPILLISIFFYINSRDEISHMTTALKCKYAVAGLNFRHPVDNSTYDPEEESDQSTWAKIIRADELMDRLEGGHLNWRILHQSWKDNRLPEHFAQWSRRWRRLHGSEWLYVLWTDEDNRKLVQKFYPEYLKSYDALPKEIYRADMVRNMYLHRFGGVYANLDLIPLSPLPRHLPILERKSAPPLRLAYVGRMSDEDFEHSIPNAFMASIPAGHPFWLEPLRFVRQHQASTKYNHQPEALTGPVALRTCVNQWLSNRDARNGKGNFDEVVVLENGKIYPFSWWDSPFKDQCICRPQSATFDAIMCNSLYPHAWTLTYWSHSWESYSW